MKITKEKEKWAAELITANKELVFQNTEKEKRAAELNIANIELVFQNGEKEKRAAELSVANIELVFQNGEKEKRAAELSVANIELVFQNGEKEKRAAELVIANVELVFQNGEKEKRAAELVIANIELVFQNGEKEKRAAELVIANVELIFQNGEKEKRAAELVIANVELVFQNKEKEKRAIELNTVNHELSFQNGEIEKMSTQLIAVNKELESFAYVASHDLQEPLRKIQTFTGRILEKDSDNLSDQGKDYFKRIQDATKRMQALINDILAFSRTNSVERKFVSTDLNILIEQLKTELKESIDAKHGTIEVSALCKANIIPFQFHQLMQNLICNALKFSNPEIPPHIIIKSKNIKANKLNNPHLSHGKDYCHISVSDNGIGFPPHYSDHIFEVFKKLHGRSEYEGTGIGLAIVKKIIENHHGYITATGELNKGATFDIYLPV